jgi:glycine hydroxymethyltransferase
MGLSLVEGGHLTHGHAVSATGKFFNAIQYGLNEKGYLDMDQVEKLALEQKPKLIWCGTTAYSRAVDFQKFGEIADKVGAYLVADISHISGLVATGAHQDPVPHVHIITTTTHKTLRGPRGGMIMVSKKGLDFDPELAKKIDKSVFPGLQ